MASPSVTAAAIALVYTALPPGTRDHVKWPGNNAARFNEHHAVSAELASQGQLEEICSLTEGWDGYGGLPIHPQTAENARSAMGTFARAGLAPDLTPSSNGTISFEWSGDGGDAYIEIGKSRYIGSIRFGDAGKYSFSGSTLSNDFFLKEMADFITAVESVLFPHRRLLSSYSNLLTVNTRNAA